MSLERIRNYIIENAQKEAEHIIRAAEEQLHTQVEAAKHSLEKHYQEMLRDEERRLLEDLKKTINTLKRDYRMKLLEIKNHVIDRVLMKAVSRIQLLPDHDYLALLGKWLAGIPEHLEGELCVNTVDLKRMTHAFIDGINKERKAKITLSATAVDVKGGFILKTEHYEIDCTLDTLIKNLRGVIVPELGDILKLSHT